MDAVWQYSFYTDTSTVTVHIRRLRAKIEVDPAAPRAHPDGVGGRLPLPAVSSTSTARGRRWIRARAGSLSRQFALAVAIVVAPVLVALVVVGLLMVVSGHAVVLVGGDRVRRPASRRRSPRGWSRRRSCATCRRSATGLMAVGRGERDVRDRDRPPHDELAELAPRGQRDDRAAPRAEEAASRPVRRRPGATWSRRSRTTCARRSPRCACSPRRSATTSSTTRRCGGGYLRADAARISTR